MDKENKDNPYISICEIGGTTYEVETAFWGTESLNRKKKYNPNGLTTQTKRVTMTVHTLFFRAAKRRNGR